MSEKKMDARNIKDAIESLEESIENRDWKKTIDFFDKVEKISLYHQLLPSTRSQFEEVKSLIQQHHTKQSAWFESPKTVRNEILKTAEHLKIIEALKGFYKDKRLKFTLQSVIGYKVLLQHKENAQAISEPTPSILSIYDELIADLDSIIQELERDLMNVQVGKLNLIKDNITVYFEAQIELALSLSNLKNEKNNLIRIYQKDIRFKDDLLPQFNRLSSQIVNDLNTLMQEVKENIVDSDSVRQGAKTKILEALKWNFTEIALEKLINLTQSLNKSNEFEISIMLMNRYKRTEQEKMKDIISKDAYEISINKINATIIQILNNL